MTPVSWGALGLASSDDVQAIFPRGNAHQVGASIQTSERRNSYPLLASISYNQRDIPLRVFRPSASALSAVGFLETVEGAFSPGTRETLTVLLDDGTTQARIECVVQTRSRVDTPGMIELTLSAMRPYFEATTATTSPSNPATVTNPGNVAVPPTITLTTATHVTRYPTTVSASVNGGLIAYPVVAALNDTDATTDTVFVFINGVSVPTFVDNSGASDSRVWFLVDTAADGSNTNVDIIVATGLVNPQGGTLPDGGMDLANSTNTSWVWDDFSVSGHPSRPGTWRYGVFMPPASINQGGSYQVQSESTSSLQVVGSVATGYGNDANGIGLMVGTQAGTSNALTGLSRVTVGSGGNAAAVRYRVANSNQWVVAWVTSTSVTVTTSIDVDDAVEIAASAYGSNFSAGGQMSLTLSASGTFALALTNTPTVTVGAAQNMDHYDGPYTIGDYTITFNHLIVPDSTLTIDCAAKTITTSVPGPQYGDDSPSFSDPDRWALVEPGAAVTITDGLSATDTVSFHAGYS